jgi:hypothetical protein
MVAAVCAALGQGGSVPNFCTAAAVSWRSVEKCVLLLRCPTFLGSASACSMAASAVTSPFLRAVGAQKSATWLDLLCPTLDLLCCSHLSG